MKKPKRKNFISAYIDEKKRLKEQALRLEQQRKEEALINKKIEILLKVVISGLMAIVGGLLMAICAIEAQGMGADVVVCFKTIISVMLIVSIPLLWIIRSK